MNEFDRLWDSAARFDDRMQSLADLKSLETQVFTMKTTCGSCARWMTNGCPRERLNARTGRRSGPSSKANKCISFLMAREYITLIEKAEQKIQTIKKALMGEPT